MLLCSRFGEFWLIRFSCSSGRCCSILRFSAHHYVLLLIRFTKRAFMWSDSISCSKFLWQLPHSLIPYIEGLKERLLVDKRFGGSWLKGLHPILLPKAWEHFWMCFFQFNRLSMVNPRHFVESTNLMLLSSENNSESLSTIVGISAMFIVKYARPRM